MRRLLPLLLSGMLTLAGCAKGLDTDYGQRKGKAVRSVNGTGVLADMFASAGHDVYSWSWLSPRLREQADCIVWIPNDFTPPPADVRAWLDDWAQTPTDPWAEYSQDYYYEEPEPAWSEDAYYEAETFSHEEIDEDGTWIAEEDFVEPWPDDPDWEPDRTLIYVCRDFDAAVDYWNKVAPNAPPEQAPRIARAASEAKSDFLAERQGVPLDEDCEWFTVRGKYQPRPVRTLSGPWAEGIDASKVEIELNGRIDQAVGAEVLLDSEGDVLVARHYVGDGQIIIVANGSFLLNLPLVNREHRKLAGKLIDEIGPPNKTVMFLESGPYGVPIHEDDPQAQVPTGMEIFFHAPGSWILWHFTAVGILFCLARWPIFGVPHDLQRNDVSDFGKHVDALAELLERSGDREHALRRLAHYQQITKRDEP